MAGNRKKYTLMVFPDLFTDRQIWENSVDPDQTAPEGVVLSGSSLFAIESMVKQHCSNLRKIKAIFLAVQFFYEFYCNWTKETTTAVRCRPNNLFCWHQITFLLPVSFMVKPCLLIQTFQFYAKICRIHLQENEAYLLSALPELNKNEKNELCAQQRLGSAWASAQSGQRLRCPQWRLFSYWEDA